MNNEVENKNEILDNSQEPVNDSFDTNPGNANHYMNNLNNMNNVNRVQYNDEYVEVKEEKKNGKGKLLLIVLIFVIVLGVLAAVLLPPMLKNDDKKKEEETKEEHPKEEQTEDETDDEGGPEFVVEDDEVLIPSDKKRTVTHDDNSSKYSKTVQDLFNFFREDTSENNILSFSPETFDDDLKIMLTLRNLDSKNRGKIKCSELDVVYYGSEKEIYATCGHWGLFHGSKYLDENGKWIKLPTQKEAKDLIIAHDKEYPKEVYMADTINATAFVNLYNKYFGAGSMKKEPFDRNYIIYYYDSKRDLFEGFEGGSGEAASNSYDEQKIVKVDEKDKTLVIYTEAINGNDEKKYSLNYSFVKEESTGNWVFKSREVK